ncbi:MAG: type II toxin-antitoxin system VapC family toxin [Ignavibacteriales bacterium]|nr:type II toxin-antitoxin system VapC family toxin [Ignavibacteriales bacterium]
MVKEITVDSSIIVSSLIYTEPRHREALSIWLDIVDGNNFAILPYTVVVEVCGAVKRRTGKLDFALETKQNLLQQKHIYFVDIDREVAEGAAKIASHVGLRGMDSIVVYIAKEYNTELKSFDEEMMSKFQMLK